MSCYDVLCTILNFENMAIDKTDTLICHRAFVLVGAGVFVEETKRNQVKYKVCQMLVNVTEKNAAGNRDRICGY